VQKQVSAGFFFTEEQQKTGSFRNRMVY